MVPRIGGALLAALLWASVVAGADPELPKFQKTLFNGACTAPPCTTGDALTGGAGLKKVRALAGVKTVGIDVTGTATFNVKCTPAHPLIAKQSNLDTETLVDALSFFKFTEACQELYLTVTACTACTVRSGVYSESGF